jgi:hypothetical protein
MVGFSKEEKSVPSVWIIKDSVSKKIHADSVKLVFKVKDVNNQLMLNQHSLVIQVKMNGKTKKYTITDKKRTFKFPLSKGKQHLSFYINANFDEINFEREFQGGHYYEVGLNFQGSASSGRQIMVEKPVIYLYTDHEEAFSLKIKTDAELQFTYPAYKEEWKGSASPDGTIQMNGSNYPYLFWDAQLPVEDLKLNWDDADQMEGINAMNYLENQLISAGFNAKEKADFITYWGPRIQKLKYVQILWVQNKDADAIASLETYPHFKQNRVYLVFRQMNELTERSLIIKNSLTPIDHSGFCLVEWGGIEIPPNL